MRTNTTTQKAIQTGRLRAAEILERRKQAQHKRADALRQLGIAPSLPPMKAARKAVPPRSSAGVLLAEGDSWFDYPFNDILKGLEDDYAYDVESVAHHGDIVEDMAYTDQLSAFTSRLQKLLRNRILPKAVLLSGGGNDIAGTEFAGLLNHALSAHPGLNLSVVAGVIDERLRDAYISILSTVTTLCQGTIGRPLPIIVHGYDYPVADGRGFAGGLWFLPGPWLEPGFRRKGYDDQVQRAVLTKILIDRFNNMVRGIVKLPGFAHVRFIDLRGTLSWRPGYKRWWANELHPMRRGFEAITAKFARELNGIREVEALNAPEARQIVAQGVSPGLKRGRNGRTLDSHATRAENRSVSRSTFRFSQGSRPGYILLPLRGFFVQGGRLSHERR